MLRNGNLLIFQQSVSLLGIKKMENKALWLEMRRKNSAKWTIKISCSPLGPRLHLGGGACQIMAECEVPSCCRLISLVRCRDTNHLVAGTRKATISKDLIAKRKGQ